MYAVARLRGIRIASLFVVSDIVGGDSWKIGFRSASCLQGKREGVRAVADALSRPLP